MRKLLVGPLCNFSAKVRLALAEKGLSVELELVPYSLGGGYAPKHPEVLAANPLGSVPVLLLEDAAIYDSTVILEYLEDRFPTPALYPRPASARARCRQLEAEADELLWPRVRALKHALSERHAAAVMLARAEVERCYARLALQLAGRDYCCDDFSVADIAMWIFVHAACTLEAAPAAEHEPLLRWFDRISARPTFAQLIEERRAHLRRLAQ